MRRALSAKRNTSANRSRKSTLAAIVLLALSGCSTQTDAKPMDVDYSSLDYGILLERAEATTKCVLEKGFVVTPRDDGGLDSEEVLSPEQQDLADQAINECDSQLGFLKDDRPSETKLTEEYYYQLKARECLDAEGYSTPEPPSLQKYLSTYGTHDHWAPWRYMGQHQLSLTDLQDLQKTCPDPAQLL